tara:strand:+ start:858 stop:959 length:102 start_codon:yes stop_codon:yes gene_type:complete
VDTKEGAKVQAINKFAQVERLEKGGEKNQHEGK